MNNNASLHQLRAAKKASEYLALTSVARRRTILQKIALAIARREREILAANQRDMRRYIGDVVMGERLELNSKKIKDMVDGAKAVARMNDVVGRILEKKKLSNGLLLKKISVPLGVVGIIYESRPNVTLDLSILALKTGNAVVLKGGKESYLTNKAIVSIIRNVLNAEGFPSDAVVLIDSRTDWKKDILNARDFIDVLIPRGGAGLIDFVREHSRIPVVETGAGVCHTFVDEEYDDIKKAAVIVAESKIQRPSACNALDTLVVHKKALAPLFAASAAKRLASAGVEIFADEMSFKILKSIYPDRLLRHAKAGDYGKEFLALKMSVKTVSNFAEGLAFIKKHTSHHSEAILTNNNKHADQFFKEVDAAVVYHNASTRFTDGAEFGMGAEVGISTQKLHARGPMGAESLTSYKWVVSGTGNMRK